MTETPSPPARRPLVVLDKRQQALRRAARPAGHQPDHRRGRGRRGHRPLGLGQVHAVPHDQPAGDDRLGHHHHRRQAAARARARTSPSCAPTSAWSSSPSTSSRTRRILENVTLGPDQGAQGRQGRGRRAASELLERVGVAGAGRQVPRPALRRPAAARRHRPGPGHGAQGDALRRADLGARPRDDQRGPRRHGRPRQARHDDDRRHPRDGLRPQGRQPGGVHGRRPDRRGGHPRGVLHQPAVDRAKDFLGKILTH